MKKQAIILMLLGLGMFQTNKAAAQSDEIQQLVLNIEKLAQFKQILSDMKKGYQILEGGYKTIKNISKGNFELHKEFLDGLMKVSPAVRNYKRVGEIINYQGILIREYRSAFDRFRQDNNFTVKEIAYLESVYNNLFKQSLRNLDELTGVITAGKMRMSDDERLRTIDRIYLDMGEKLTFLRQFNTETAVLAKQREKEKNDAESLKKMYGIH